MLKETLREAIFPRLGQLKTSSKGWLTRNCMLCQHRGQSADTRGRFGIRVEPDGSLAAHCFNCAFKASYQPTRLLSKDFVWFLKHIGVSDDDLKVLKFQAFREKEAGEIFSKPDITKDVRYQWKEVQLPQDSQPIMFWLENGLDDEKFLSVAEYCIDRGLNTHHIYWSPCSKQMTNRRIIIPFTYDGKIVGYTGRYYTDKAPSGIPKYINSTPDSYVYNLDAQLPRFPFTILCEGVLDAYLTNGVSCLGTLNKQQVDIINNIGKRIIVCPDRDDDGQHLVDRAIENGWEVSFPNWDSNIKDVGQAVQKYGKLLTLRSIVESATQNPTKIQINRRLDKYDR